MHQQLKHYLEECKMEDVQPVNVSIEGVVLTGAIYFSPHHQKTFVYVIGDHPLIYKKSGKEYAKRGVCFRIPNDERDWYIASYFHPGLHKTYFKTEPKADPKYQPFGNNFLLSPWDIPGKPDDKIDTYERKPYERRDIKVEAA